MLTGRLVVFPGDFPRLKQGRAFFFALDNEDSKGSDP